MSVADIQKKHIQLALKELKYLFSKLGSKEASIDPHDMDQVVKKIAKKCYLFLDKPEFKHFKPYLKGCADMLLFYNNHVKSNQIGKRSGKYSTDSTSVPDNRQLAVVNRNTSNLLLGLADKGLSPQQLEVMINAALSYQQMELEYNLRQQALVIQQQMHQQTLDLQRQSMLLHPDVLMAQAKKTEQNFKIFKTLFAWVFIFAVSITSGAYANRIANIAGNPIRSLTTYLSNVGVVKSTHIDVFFNWLNTSVTSTQDSVIYAVGAIVFLTLATLYCLSESNIHIPLLINITRPQPQNTHGSSTYQHPVFVPPISDKNSPTTTRSLRLKE